MFECFIKNLLGLQCGRILHMDSNSNQKMQWQLLFMLFCQCSYGSGRKVQRCIFVLEVWDWDHGSVTVAQWNLSGIQWITVIKSCVIYVLLYRDVGEDLLLLECTLSFNRFVFQGKIPYKYRVYTPKTIENEWKDAPYEFIYNTYPEIPAEFANRIFDVPFEYCRVQRELIV